MKYFCLLFLLFISACSHPDKAIKPKVIVIQPFQGFPETLNQEVYEQLKQVDSFVFIKKAIPLPSRAYYPPRNRYRADILISYLNEFSTKDTVIIGMTDKDISTTKNDIKDWGIMGLGYEPGNACVVSTFRLSKSNMAAQFYKLALHELGHTQGLKHCPTASCFMRDAAGGNHLDEERGFCPSCKSYLLKKGWILQ